MDLHDYLRVLRKRWRVIVLTLGLAVGVAAGLTASVTPMYAASTRFFVSTSGGDNAASLQQGNTFTQQRVKSYAQLLGSPTVLDPVVEQLGLEESATDLARNVSTTIPLDTVIIEVRVTDPERVRAVEIAAAIGEVFPETVAELERVSTQEASPVKVTVVKPAQSDPTPVRPRPGRNIAAGLVLGVFIGVGVALLRDALDTRIKSQRDLLEVTSHAVIGGVPFDPSAQSTPLIIQGDLRSSRAESLRSVRTNLRFLHVERPPRSIVVTSSIPREGKSTTTANLALCIAETGSTVVVVEGDLRRPRLLEYLGYEGSVGLTDVLIGGASLDDVLQPFGDTTVSVLGAGLIPPNPSELVGSAIMGSVVEDLSGRFDFVLIDAPPLLPVTDAALLSTHVDGTVVVVGADMVSKDQVRNALHSLEAVNATVLGVILNRVKRNDTRSYGTYRYAYEPESNRGRAKRLRRRASPRQTDRPAPTGLVAWPVAAEVGDSSPATVAKRPLRAEDVSQHR